MSAASIAENIYGAHATVRDRRAQRIAPETVSDAGLPIIDIGPLRLGTRARKARVIDCIGKAASDTGFLYVVGHGVPEAIIRDAEAAAAEFFSLPESEKLKYYIGLSRNHRGYVPFFEQGDYADEGQGKRRYEAFDMAVDLPADDPDYLAGHPLLGPNVWPALADFKESISKYYDEIAKLGRVLCGAFAAYLGIPEESLTRLMDKPTSQLRLLHYIRNEAVNDAAAGVNMGAHTDYEFFTILRQTRPALQVMDRGNRWLDATPIEGSFVMHIGDMLEVLSNGVFRATPHKVVNDGNERYSMPFFVAGNYDAKIEPLKELPQSNAAEPYQAYVAGHHLLGQLLRDFPYLRRRWEAGQMPLDFTPPGCNPFEERLRGPV